MRHVWSLKITDELTISTLETDAKLIGIILAESHSQRAVAPTGRQINTKCINTLHIYLHLNILNCSLPGIAAGILPKQTHRYISLEAAERICFLRVRTVLACMVIEQGS